MAEHTQRLEGRHVVVTGGGRGIGRAGEPADVAGTVAWLLSDDARGVTGRAIDQNGGAWMD